MHIIYKTRDLSVLLKNTAREIESGLLDVGPFPTARMTLQGARSRNVRVIQKGSTV